MIRTRVAPSCAPSHRALFYPAELIRIASEQSSSTVDASKEGERNARVFEALEEGNGLREIVTTLRLPVDIATKLHASWLKMGDGHDMIERGKFDHQLSDVLAIVGHIAARNHDVASAISRLGTDLGSDLDHRLNAAVTYEVHGASSHYGR